MRKHAFYLLSLLCSILWLGIVYMIFGDQHPSDQELRPPHQLSLLAERVEGFESRMAEQMEENRKLLKQINSWGLQAEIADSSVEKRSDSQEENAQPVDNKVREEEEEENGEEEEENGGEEAPLKDLDPPVIPVLLFACNRVSVNKALDLLVAYRPNKQQFPIIVSQDCGHQETANVIRGYGDQIISIQQPDLTEPVVPPKEKKFRGYFKIARHYGWALNQTFNVFGYNQVVIVEDDLEVAPDFYEYFAATLPILRSDASLWCVSAWNDNGKSGLIDEEKAADMLYRTDFFPGLGWMITKDMWTELGAKWPRSYWDDWMREPGQRRERACIRPEISRTKTFGKIGVSNGLFFEKHLKKIVLSTKFVPFTVLDLNYLKKEQYDKSYIDAVYKTAVYSLEDVKKGAMPEQIVRITYRTRENFKKISKSLGIMDDFKSGVPRMAYRGIVSFMYRGRRVYLAPNINWQGYNPKWA